MLTGKKRSLTISVTKTLAGVVVTGYPKTYYGLQAFGIYGAITPDQMSLMSVNAYEDRLSSFIAHVQAQESGLVIQAAQTNEPYY